MRENIREWLIAVLAVLVIMVPGYGLAVGIDDINVPPRNDVTIGWAAMTNVTNSTSYQNTDGSGITDKVQCTFTVVGTDVMTAWLQFSTDDSSFINATAAVSSINNNNSETFAFAEDVRGGSYWRWHGVSGFDVSNTVAFSCDFTR
jgi:hypothetical protein